MSNTDNTAIVNVSITDQGPKNDVFAPPRFTDEQRIENIKNALPEIRTLFENEFKANHYPGLSYGIVVDGELIDSYSFGYTDLERKIPATAKSLFRMASMTKSFTAMAIVKLRDDGKLRLDDPVTQYIPEFQVTNLLTNDAPIITIRHLLSQDAGLPEDDPWADRQLAITDDVFLAMLKKGVSLSNPPATQWEYNNLCYAMLGRIITVVSEVPYQEYIKREILHPLGMVNTFWEYSEVPSDLLAHGYRWESDRYSEENLLHDGSYGAMGGLISSVEDFSKYISYHLQAWPPRNEPESGPLRRSSLREMHRPRNFIGFEADANRLFSFITTAYCYGLGWSKNSNGIVSISHAGGLPGFGSRWTILPEYGIGVVAFANRTYADLFDVNTSVLIELIDLGELEPRQLPISKYLAQRKEQLIALILHKKWNITDSEIPTIFAENFFLDHTLELRKNASEELLNQAGEIATIGDLIPKNQLRGHFHLKGEHATIQINFSLSPKIRH